MSGGNIYEDYTETAQYISRNFIVQYKYMNITEHSRKQKLQKKTRWIYSPENE
jgi:hypothetical protein